MSLLARGDVLAARYRIEGVLGRGGMGVVYAARHLALGRTVALKVLDAPHGGDDGQKRFAREAKTLARLDHPGVVGVLDHGRTVDGKLYLCMEKLDGPTLAELLGERGALPVGHAVRIAVELCEALAYAHGQGVLHRDLKPSNVILARRGAGTRVVLIDFGLARLVDDAAITAAHACMGSPSYVAPERLAMPVARDDARSDLYSLGIVLFEMLTGERPFGEGSAVEVAVRQLSATPPAIERRDVPPALAQLVSRLLAKEPGERFPDAASVKLALQRAVVPPPPRAMTEQVRAVAASTSLDRFEAARTLDYRLGSGSVFRRIWAWWRHGAWRWSEGERARSG